MGKQLIFVSGFGDSKSYFYRLLARAWRNSHFTSYVYIFGWDDKSTDYGTKYERFLNFVDTLPNNDELYLVGISAGGTIALRTLADRPYIKKVVAVSSPLKQSSKFTDEGLRAAIVQSEAAYPIIDAKIKAVTIRGWHDGVVPPRLTELSGAHNRRIFGFGHAMNIVVATLIARRSLRKLLIA